MNAFIEFLKQYWFQLVTGLFALIQIILIIVKRKPKSVDDFRLALFEALASIPELVTACERPGEGVLKRTEVEIGCLKYIEKVLGRSLSQNEIDLVKTDVDNKIETVLSTPTKKGDLNEK